MGKGEGILVTFKLGPEYLSDRERWPCFRKRLEVAPWAGAISGTISLDHQIYEMLGSPQELEVAILGKP